MGDAGPRDCLESEVTFQGGSCRSFSSATQPHDLGTHFLTSWAFGSPDCKWMLRDLFCRDLIKMSRNRLHKV